MACAEKGIYRCVLNLVSNALDACEDEGSRVTVISRQINDESVQVDVADEGCGMNAETLATVFQPFVSSKGSQGTGLGLSITKKSSRNTAVAWRSIPPKAAAARFRSYSP